LTWVVRVTANAERDLHRLGEFLAKDNPRAADAARADIKDALRSLQELPGRGRPGPNGLRELPIMSGHYGYIVRYRVSEKIVLVTRIFHALEAR
jgi:toxin ParE1/3/4